MDGERTVFHNDIGPELRPQRLVRDQSAAGLDQHDQDLPSLCGNGDAPAIARQAVLCSIEDKWTKLKSWHRLLLYTCLIQS
jgi:hypothetical protein